MHIWTPGISPRRQYLCGIAFSEKVVPRMGMGMGTGDLSRTGTGKNKQSPHGGRPVVPTIVGVVNRNFELIEL
jgi:hypothetical protein